MNRIRLLTSEAWSSLSANLSTTFAATAEVVRYFNAVPLLVDCRPEDLNLDVSDARQQIEMALARGQVGQARAVRGACRELVCVAR